VLNGRREHKLRETIAGLDAQRALIHPGDVSDETYVKRLVEDAIARFEKLDVLVNNAGFAIFGPFAQTTTEHWRKIMGTNLDSVFSGAREALPHLLKTKGCIVNLSSASGLGGNWGMSSYNVAKGTVTNFKRALALEYGSRGVRINAVAPSFTSTEATVDFEKSEALIAARSRELAIRIALGSGRRRVSMQLLTEAFVLSLAGGAVGLITAKLLLAVLNHWQPAAEVHLAAGVDTVVFLEGLALTLASGLMFGIVPAWHAWHSSPLQAIKSGAGDGTQLRRFALRDLFLGVQIAICTFLVTASLVAVRGMEHALHVPRTTRPIGFRAARCYAGRN
jgi:meso-butanediol dehydrogenase/(S,S)-butanediol dehydrogenase/diacetyl reductase